MNFTNNPFCNIHYLFKYNLSQSSNLAHHSWKFVARDAQSFSAFWHEISCSVSVINIREETLVLFSLIASAMRSSKRIKILHFGKSVS